MPIEAKMITNTIESAQKKLEARNFGIRKNVLEFDDVMNQQREIIYGQRRKVLNGEDLQDTMHQMLRDDVHGSVETFLAGDIADDWDFAALRRHYLGWLCLKTDFHYTTAELNDLNKQDVEDMLVDRALKVLHNKEQKYGSEIMRELERICLLRNVDLKWMDHIDSMDQLRQGIYLRSYGQRDPVVEYRFEGFEMFDAMVESIRQDAIRMLLTIELRDKSQQVKREQVAKPTGEGAVPHKGAKGNAPVRVQKIGRNDPCPCGSGLKWKKCTCAQYHPDLAGNADQQPQKS